MKRKWIVGALGLLLFVVSLVLLAGCAEADRAAADRAHAQAGLEVARGQAYAERVAADTAAASERAATREAARDASHQRALELLPYVLLIWGGLLLVGFAAFVVWDLRSLRERQAPAATDPALLLYLDRLRLEQAERDREVWRALGTLARHTLPAGVGTGVTIYPEREER